MKLKTTNVHPQPQGSPVRFKSLRVLTKLTIWTEIVPSRTVISTSGRLTNCLIELSDCWIKIQADKAAASWSPKVGTIERKSSDHNLHSWTDWMDGWCAITVMGSKWSTVAAQVFAWKCSRIRSSRPVPVRSTLRSKLIESDVTERGESWVMRLREINNHRLALQWIV